MMNSSPSWEDSVRLADGSVELDIERLHVAVGLALSQSDSSGSGPVRPPWCAVVSSLRSSALTISGSSMNWSSMNVPSRCPRARLSLTSTPMAG